MTTFYQNNQNPFSHQIAELDYNSSNAIKTINKKIRQNIKQKIKIKKNQLSIINAKSGYGKTFLLYQIKQKNNKSALISFTKIKNFKLEYFSQFIYKHCIEKNLLKNIIKSGLKESKSQINYSKKNLKNHLPSIIKHLTAFYQDKYNLPHELCYFWLNFYQNYKLNKKDSNCLLPLKSTSLQNQNSISKIDNEKFLLSFFILFFSEKNSPKLNILFDSIDQFYLNYNAQLELKKILNLIIYSKAYNHIILSGTNINKLLNKNELANLEKFTAISKYKLKNISQDEFNSLAKKRLKNIGYSKNKQKLLAQLPKISEISIRQALIVLEKKYTQLNKKNSQLILTHN